MSTPAANNESQPSAPAAHPAPKKPVFLSFLAGIPAVLAAGSVLALLSLSSSRETLAKSYTTELERRSKLLDQKYDEENARGALVCVKRLLDWSPADARLRYMMVKLYEQMGDGQRAEAIARTLAPLEGASYAPAHLWLAGRYMGDANRLRRVAPLAEVHLRRFLQFDPTNKIARLLLGELYFMTGHFKEARPHLEATATGNPKYLLDLAMICTALGDKEEGKRHEIEARRVAKQKAEADPTDKLARLAWASATNQLGNFGEAVQILEQGYEQSKDEVFKKSIAQVCKNWVGSMLQTGQAKPGEKLAIIERGLANDPSNMDLLQLLGALMAGKGPEAQKAREEIKAQLASGQMAGLAHFLMGNDAWTHERIEEAREHWDQSYSLDPTQILSANNLAWALAFKDPIDLDRAIKLMDDITKVEPNNPVLRATRGQILVKLSRHKEALKDMEFALRGNQDSDDLHKSLATAYDALGMKEMAAEHLKPRPKPTAAAPAAGLNTPTPSATPLSVPNPSSGSRPDISTPK